MHTFVKDTISKTRDKLAKYLTHRTSREAAIKYIAY